MVFDLERRQVFGFEFKLSFCLNDAIMGILLFLERNLKNKRKQGRRVYYYVRDGLDLTLSYIV